MGRGREHMVEMWRDGHIWERSLGDPLGGHTDMRVFVSYSYRDRSQAGRIKKILSEFEIDGFLAHDDIEVSGEWRERIMTELEQCRVFVVLLSESFKASDWAPQEMGIAAMRRNVLIVPLSLDGTTPLGFISHLQSERFPGAANPLPLVLGPICMRFPDETVPRIISALAGSWAYRRSEALMDSTNRSKGR
jgi:TIR domain